MSSELALSSITPLIKPSYRGGIYFNTSKERIKNTNFYFSVIERQKIATDSHVQFVEFRKNGISKFRDSVTSLFLDVSDGGRLRIMPAFKRQ